MSGTDPGERKRVGLTRFGLEGRRAEVAAQIANGVTLREALRNAGYSESVAEKQPPNIINPIKQLAISRCAKRGLTLELVIDRVLAMLHATTLKNVKLEGGDIEETVIVEDNMAVNAAIKQAALMIGANLPAELDVNLRAKIEVAELRRAHEATVNRVAGYLE